MLLPHIWWKCRGPGKSQKAVWFASRLSPESQNAGICCRLQKPLQESIPLFSWWWRTNHAVKLVPAASLLLACGQLAGDLWGMKIQNESETSYHLNNQEVISHYLLHWYNSRQSITLLISPHILCRNNRQGLNVEKQLLFTLTFK